MTIEFTDSELALLADLVYAGNWVMNGWRLPCEIIGTYKDIFDRVFGLLIKNKVENSVSGESENEIYRDTEEDVYRRMESCWKNFTDKEVLSRFAELLAEYRYGGEQSGERSEAADGYREELDKNYLKNVKIGVK